MPFVDDVNLLLRDHLGYTGDGNGGQGALPIGDRSTARNMIDLRDLRQLLVTMAQTMGDPSALQQILTDLNPARMQLPAGTDLNTVRTNGIYYGNATLPYVNAPFTGKAFYLTIETPGVAGNNLSRWVLQRLSPADTSGEIYIRHVDANNASNTFPWRLAATSIYRGSPAAPNLNTLLDPGTYVIPVGFINGPADFTEPTAVMHVLPFGSNFTMQMFRGTGNNGQIWTRIVRPTTNAFGTWFQIGASSSPLAGKQMVFLGDSITENYDIPQRVATLTGARAVNGGFGGTRLTEMTGNLAGMCGVDIADAIATGNWGLVEAGAEARAAAVPTDDNRPIVARLKAVNWATVDYIVCWWGTNDYSNNVPLGLEGDDDRLSFRGAANRVVRRILTAHPHIRIMWVTPFFRGRINVGDARDSDNFPNNAGTFLLEYGDALRGIAARHNLPALDLYRTSGINLQNYATYLSPQDLDGLHPRLPAGQALLADKIAGFLLSGDGSGKPDNEQPLLAVNDLGIPLIPFEKRLNYGEPQPVEQLTGLDPQGNRLFGFDAVGNPAYQTEAVLSYDGAAGADWDFAVLGEDNRPLLRWKNGVLLEGSADFAHLPLTEKIALSSGLNWNGRGLIRREPALYLSDPLYNQPSAQIFPSSADMQAHYDQLVTDFPQYVTRSSVGATREGVPIYQYVFAAPPNIRDGWSAADAAPPKIISVSGIHGGERQAVVRQYLFFRNLCRHWRILPHYARFRFGATFVAIPMVNPFGMDAPQRGNSNGVDINRNFPAGWNDAPSDSRGSSAGSEPETQALMNALSLHPDALVVIDNHNGGLEQAELWFGTLRRPDLELIKSVLPSLVDYMRGTVNPAFAEQGTMALLSANGAGTLARYAQEVAGLPGILIEQTAGPNHVQMDGTHLSHRRLGELTFIEIFNALLDRDARRRMEQEA